MGIFFMVYRDQFFPLTVLQLASYNHPEHEVGHLYTRFQVCSASIFPL